MNLDKTNMKKIIFLISLTIFLIWLSFNYIIIIKFFNLLINLFLPIILGVVFAFILNVVMNQLEEKLFKKYKKKHKKLIRAVSLVLTIFIFLSIILLLIFLVVPEFINAILNITKNATENKGIFKDVFKFLENISPNIKKYISDINYKTILSMHFKDSSEMISKTFSFISDFISKLVTGFIGFIIAIYILVDKENLIKKTKKVLYALLDKAYVKKIINIVKIANDTFTKFLTGQCLDAILTGFLFGIVLFICKVPYFVILGVLFSFTALIPYIGAFITLVCGFILIFVTSPIKALWYVIIFFLVQQFDDNFTYPKIVGAKVGLPALISLVSVILGGTLFGFVGMIISIPLVSILYGVFKSYINEKLKEKSINNLD